MNILRPGQIVHDSVKIIDFLGGGGQSFTFTGEYLDQSLPENRRKVFVKQYNDLLSDSAEYHKVAEHYKLMHERLADKKHYFCLPDFIAPFESAIVAIFPILPGRSLEEWMLEGLTEQLSTRFAFALTTAVLALHRAGIAHLDLKPENVLIDQNARSKKFFVHLIDVDAATVDGHGLRGNIYGSPGYMSPEHVSGFRRQFIGRPSDIYSLGIMLSELLFKKYPFPAFAEGQQVLDQSAEIPDGHVDPELTAIIRRCFSLDSRKRPFANEILRSLNESSILKEHTAGIDRDDKHLRRRPKGGSQSQTKRAYSSRRVKNSVGSDQLRVQIVQEGGFERSYYSSKTLTRRNFVGSTISSEERSGEVFCIELKVERDKVYLENRCEGLSLTVLRDMSPVEVGGAIEVQSGDIFEIAGTGILSIFKRRHRFEIKIH